MGSTPPLKVIPADGQADTRLATALSNQVMAMSFSPLRACAMARKNQLELTRSPQIGRVEPRRPAEHQSRRRSLVFSPSLSEPRYEEDHYRPDGEVVTVDFSLKPVCDESGRVVLLIPEPPPSVCGMIRIGRTVDLPQPPATGRCRITPAVSIVHRSIACIGD
jgi:hypothetical protein